MSWFPLSFGAPAVLWGLLALPVIWWLLRLTPPRPQTEIFPPLRILARVLKKEETPHQSPWWLTLLRLVMAGLLVAALAEPVFNPRAELPKTGAALALVIDNGWAAAPDWPRRVATAERMIDEAEQSSLPILLAFTAEKENQQIGPFSADEARSRLNAVKPRPVPTERLGTYTRVGKALGDLPPAILAISSDGLAGPDDEAAFAALTATTPPASIIWASPDRLDIVGLTNSINGTDRFTITAVRSASVAAAPEFVTAGAYDNKGRRLGDARFAFQPGATEATGDIIVPFELRNDFSSIALDGMPNAGAVRVLDGTSTRRRVGLISETPVDEARLLLSPLHYIRLAMLPFADLVEPTSPDLVAGITEILEQKPAVIVLADTGTIPDDVRPKLIDWMEQGGTLVRFASSRLLTVAADNDLLPVPLRRSERLLGGALSWAGPQPVGEFPKNGPFASLPAPTDVTVSRQLLAEPTADLVDHTWATLADGTPLVTGDRRGKGMLVLFHVTPEATWSTLPISGTFVEMLRRIVQLSRNQGSGSAQSTTATTLPPYRMISANGAITGPESDTRPLVIGAGPQPVTVDNPPGLYGGEEGVVAHNLLPAGSALPAIVMPQFGAPVTKISYVDDQAQALKGPLIAAAVLLLIADTLIMLWMGGLIARLRRARLSTATPALLAAAFLLAPLDHARADDSKPGDQAAIEAVSKTHLAYVITGVPAVDSVSRAGLDGLTRFLIEKTALEPGTPAGVHIDRDELSFYPLIYWPIDPSAPMPDRAAIARVEAYMQQGGSVLFDTRDQYSTGFAPGSTSPATERLREILATLSVPPLEPVPSDHVLTKSFFILEQFPGRFNGGPLWVEASLEATNTQNRPVRTGDGVSPILITSNDFAGAWAIDALGEPLLPTVPSDPMQRTYALRAGVNIVIYMLTGNYKSDQVHVPALLERLGQ